MPIALTIAGSDSGGGAGLQADLKTFAALGVHGTSVITCITAQNPTQVLGIQACTPRIVRQQIEAVLAELPPAAVKTGMLFSTSVVRIVAEALRHRRGVPLIVDPVMVSTSGARLLKPSAVRALLAELLPLADLVTPNLEEAGILVGVPLRSVEDLRLAARTIQGRYGCAALAKGGHLRDSGEAIDVFYDGENELVLRAPFVKGLSTHGTGCTCSAAITGYLALGCSLLHAVQMAKKHVTQAIAQSLVVAHHHTLNAFWED